jgi:hypothetical protein
MRCRHFICFVSMLCMVNVATAQKNLVTNGGFEDDDLYGWNNNGAMQTPYNFKSGKSSCAIVTTNTENWVGIDQTIQIPKKVQNVEFSAWIRTTNVIKGKNDWDGAVFTVVFLDGNDKEIGAGVNIARITGSTDWTFYDKVIKMQEKAYSFKILAAMGNASGTMLIDDVSAKAVDK